MNEENQKNYEIAFLLSSPEATKSVSNTLIQHQAELAYQSPISEIKLAYPIKKRTAAQFGFYHFRASADAVKKIKEALILDHSILRFMIITPPVKLALANQPRPERKPVAPIVSNKVLEEKLEEILK